MCNVGGFAATYVQAARDYVHFFTSDQLVAGLENTWCIRSTFPLEHQVDMKTNLGGSHISAANTEEHAGFTIHYTSRLHKLTLYCSVFLAFSIFRERACAWASVVEKEHQ